MQKKKLHANAALFVVLGVIALISVGLVLAMFSSSAPLSDSLLAKVYQQARLTSTARQTGESFKVRISDDYTTVATLGNTMNIRGVGFTKTGNDIHIGDKQVSNVDSKEDGTVLTFKIPGGKDLATGTYQMYIKNSRGTSNSTEIRIVDADAPTISDDYPPVAELGGTMRIVGTGFTPTNNDVHIGNRQVSDVKSTDNGTVLSVKLPAGKDLPTGDYQMYIKNPKGLSNSTAMRIVNPGAPMLTSISPTAGPAGTVITITGTQFAPAANKVHFGTATKNSVNATQLGKQMKYRVTPLNQTGKYKISVETSKGVSNELTFEVIPGQ